MKKTIKIFVSSPMDVIAERQKAMQIIKRLNRNFVDVEIEGIFWERQALKATQDYQKNIVYPSSTDIVAVILWTRLGSDLSSEYVGAYSNKQPITGTEWEFEDAYAKAVNNDNKPHLSLYRKENPEIKIDPKKIDEMQYQKKLIEAFDDYWAKNDDGSYAMASHYFKRTDEFEEMFEMHLKELIGNILNQKLEFKANWLQGSPFRGLQSFEAEHSSLFFGREREKNESREKLEQQIAKGKSFLLVTGASGSGKSSLVKAGLLPDLQIEGMIHHVALTRVASFSPSDDEPIKALISSIFKALPELKELQFDETNLLKHLDDALPIKQALDNISKRENLTQIAQAKLIIYVDQFEELFTTPTIDEPMQQKFIELLFKLFSSPYVWVVASMRSDFMSHLERFPKLIDLLNGGAEYKLSFPQQTEIGQIISRPAQEAGLSFEHNENGKYLNEFLQESASKEKSSLPLLEYLLNQLWEMRDSEKNQLTFKAYQELGGLEGAMGKKATEVYESLEIEEQKAMSRLIIMLASVAEEGEQKITAKKVNKNQIEKNPTIKACAKALLREDVRLLISSKDAEGNDYYRMAHEAIFSHWKLARESILEDKKDIQLRDKLEKDAQQWKDAKDGYKKAYLINDGLPLTLALDLLSRRESELEEKVVKFINSSKTRVQRGKFVVKTLWGTLLLISVLVSVFMYGLMEEANREREEVERVTEKLVAIISRYQKKGVEGIGVVKIDVEVFESIIKDFKKSTNNKILKNVEASYSMLCFFYSNEKEYEKSINACKQAIKLNPTNDNAYNNMGNTYNSKEEYDKAITAYQKAIKINPKSGAYFNLGLIYELKEEYSNAIEVYKKSIEIDPKRNKSYIRMGIMYYNMGNNFFTLKEYDKAIERYQKAVEVNPKLYSAYLNMGNTYSKKNIYDKAIKSYQKAMEINPEDDRVYSSLGIMYYNIGNEYTALKEYDKAIEEYQRAVEYFPEYYSTYFNMGNVYAQKKLYDKAIELYDKAIEMNPKEYKTYYSMGIVYDSTKKYDKAIKAYKKAIKINPNNSHVHHNIGMSYYHKKEYENAIKSYQISSVISKKLIKFNEDNSKLKIDLLKNYGMIGEVYKIQNRWNDALLEFMKFLPIMKKVLDKDPDNYKWRSIAYYTYSQMAISYRALNDEVNAKKFEIKSKLLDP